MLRSLTYTSAAVNVKKCTITPYLKHPLYCIWKTTEILFGIWLFLGHKCIKC